MDIRKWLKSPPSAKSDTIPTSPDVVGGDPGRQSEPEPVASSSVEPDPGSGRTSSGHGTEATSSRSSATATGAVFEPQLPVGSVGVSDLGTDKPKQVVLKKYPVKMFCAKKRSFSSSWYLNRDWLEYSVEKDAAFCYACRKLKSVSSDATFSIKGFNDWKHAIETGKALNKHAASKEHLACEAMWRDSEKRRETERDFHSLKFRATGAQQILHLSRN